MINKAIKFLKEVWAEAAPRGKVTWPSRKIVIASTAVVFVTVALVSFYIAIVDFILSRLLRLLLVR